MTDLKGLSVEITYLCVSTENVDTVVCVPFALQYSVWSTRRILVIWSSSDCNSSVSNTGL